MILFIALVIAFVIAFVLAVVVSMASDPPAPGPTDASAKDLVTGKWNRDFDRAVDAGVQRQQTAIYLWIATVALLIGTLAAGVAAFG